MGSIKDLDSTALYAYTTLVSVLICVPAALIVEGKHLSAGIDKALAKNPNFYWALLSVGLLYHLYNQVRWETGKTSLAPGLAWQPLWNVLHTRNNNIFGTSRTPTPTGPGVPPLQPGALGTHAHMPADRRGQPSTCACLAPPVARATLKAHEHVWHVLSGTVESNQAELLVPALQFAFNTLSRVSPVSHGVANVVKRVVIIGTSVVFFGTTLTPKTKAGEQAPQDKQGSGMQAGAFLLCDICHVFEMAECGAGVCNMMPWLAQQPTLQPAVSQWDA